MVFITSGALRVKAPVLLVLALALAVLGSIALPASAHAEGFLSKTVKCLLTIKILTGCKTPTTPVSPTKDSQQPRSNESSPVNQPTNPDSTLNNSSSQSSKKLVTGEPLALPTSELAPVKPLVGIETDVVAKVGKNSYLASTALGPPSSGVATVQSGAPVAETILERSETGWKIAGIAWYWWVLLIGVCMATTASIKRGKLRKISTLPKQ